jgi:type I restriction enzyme R subunit
LDESVVVEETSDLKLTKPEFVIKQSGKTWDLSKLDFEKLAAEFKEADYKNIEIADLRAFIQNKLDQMMKENATRADFAQRLQDIVDRYNSGSSSADSYFDELVQFTKDLKEESERPSPPRRSKRRRVGNVRPPQEREE